MATATGSFGKWGNLPQGWRWVELREVADLISGSSAPQREDSFADVGPFFVRVSDLVRSDSKGVIREARDSLSSLAIATNSLVQAPQGSVVLPKSGAAIATNKRAILGMDSYIVGHLLALTPLPEVILTEWLYYSLKQIDMVEHSENPSYPSLKKSVVANIKIPLPPISEQRRIIGALDAQIGATGKARGAALGRIEAGRALFSAYLREVFEFGEELPHGWRWVALGEVADYINGKAFKPEDWESSGLPIVRIQNLNNDSAPYNYYSGNVRDRHLIKNGDLLVSWSASLDSFIWDRGDAILNQHIFKVVENSSLVRRDFLHFSIKNAMGRIKERIHGATMQHITKPDFESVKIPLPPLAEQKRLVAALSAKMAAVEAVCGAAEAELEAIEALPGALLRRAFGGEV